MLNQAGDDVDRFGALPDIFKPKNALFCCLAAYLLVIAIAFLPHKYPGGVDVSTHLFQIGLIANEGLTGWNHWWYAGHPLLEQYPPLPHALGALLSIPFGVENAYKIIAAAAMLLIPVSFYFLLKEFDLDGKQRAYALYFFAFSPVFIQYFHGGVMSALFALPFAILFLKFLSTALKPPAVRMQYAVLSAVFMALCALSHLFMPVAAGAFGFLFVVSFAPRMRSLFTLAAIGLISAFLVAFFWVPLAIGGGVSDSTPALSSLSPIQSAIIAIAPFGRAYIASISIFSVLLFAFTIVLSALAAFLAYTKRSHGILLFTALSLVLFVVWSLLLPQAGQAGVKLPLFLPIVLGLLFGKAFGVNGLADRLFCALAALFLIFFILAPPSFAPDSSYSISEWAAGKAEYRALFLPQGYGLSVAEGGKTNSDTYMYDAYLFPIDFKKENYWGWFSEAKPRLDSDRGITFTCTRTATGGEMVSRILSVSSSTTQTFVNCTIDTTPESFCGTLQEGAVDHVFVNTNFPEVESFAERSPCLSEDGRNFPLVSYRVKNAKPYVDGGFGYSKKSGKITVDFIGPINGALSIRESFSGRFVAHIDGNPTSVSRSDTGFVSVGISSGEGNHSLTLEYAQKGYAPLLNALSLSAWVFCIGYLLIAWKRHIL